MHSAQEIIRAGRALIGNTAYDFKATPAQAPDVVSCQTFVWMLLQAARPGMVPWLMSAQLYWGLPAEDVPEEDICLVFRKGPKWNFWDKGRARGGVGHVGIGTPESTVLHCSQSKGTAVEESFEDFFGRPDAFRGIYRVPKR